MSTFSSSMIMPGIAVPFQQTVDPAHLGVYLNLDQAEQLRIRRYDEAWRFYYGKHWSFAREDGEPLVTVNYYRKFLDKIAEFLVGKGQVITVPEVLAGVSKTFLDQVWKENEQRRLLWDMAIMGGVSGDVFALLTYEEPTEVQRGVNPFARGKIRVNLLGSEQVFPTWDPLNVDRLQSVRIETVFYAESADTSSRTADHMSVRRFTQTITPQVIMEQFQDEPPTIKPNTLQEIPLVHIKNISVPKEYYGMSDGQDLIDLNREFNEKSTDISDTINYHSAPITVITGAKVKDLDKGAKQIWSGLPAGAKVFNLALEGDLGAANKYRDSIKMSMHEIGDVPEGVLGREQSISNTSGIAMHLQYQPLIGKTRRKRATYEPGLEKINYFILRIGLLTGQISLPFDLCKNCGGRIVEMDSDRTQPMWDQELEDYVEVPIKVKRCFQVDKQTLDFQDPYKLKIKVWREYGFGGEVREVPIEEARTISAGAKSFWDYAYVDVEADQQYKKELRAAQEAAYAAAVQAQQQAPAAGEQGQPSAAPVPVTAPPPPIPKVKSLPPSEVDVPEEPEQVRINTPLLHPATGEFIRYRSEDRLIIPTGCCSPLYMDPFETTVKLVDVLPKDDAVQAKLYQMYQDSKWVDREWVQAQIPDIAQDMHAINKRMKTAASLADDAEKGERLGDRVDDLSPHSPPISHVQGPAGDPVAPEDSEG